MAKREQRLRAGATSRAGARRTGRAPRAVRVVREVVRRERMGENLTNALIELMNPLEQDLSKEWD